MKKPLLCASLIACASCLAPARPSWKRRAALHAAVAAAPACANATLALRGGGRRRGRGAAGA